MTFVKFVCVAGLTMAAVSASAAEAPLRVLVPAYAQAAVTTLKPMIESQTGVAIALEAATTLWTRALAVANSAPPAEVASSSAPTVARALAKVLQGLGSFAAAQSLIDQAERLENPTAEHAENAEHGSGGA